MATRQTLIAALVNAAACHSNLQVSDVCLSLAALERHVATTTTAAVPIPTTTAPTATSPLGAGPAPDSSHAACPSPGPGPPARPRQAFMPAPDAAPPAPLAAAKEPSIHTPCSPALLRLPPQQQRLFVAPELYGSGNSAVGDNTNGAGAPSRPLTSGAAAVAAAAAAAAAATNVADDGVPTVAEEEEGEDQESKAQGQTHEQGAPAAGPSPASDVYAFGGLLWAMAGGHTLLGTEELLEPSVGPGGGWRAGLNRCAGGRML